MPTPYSPTGIIWQTEAINEWVFLPHKQTKLLTTYVDMVGKLIFKMITRIQQLSGYNPKTIVVPFSKTQIEHLYSKYWMANSPFWLYWQHWLPLPFF